MEKFYQERKKAVANFLRSFYLRKQLSEVSGYDENADLSTRSEMVPENPFSADLAAGQIRLLSQAEEITYVVLLRRWEEDSFVVMPFSHYDHPATNEEFKTDFDGGLFMRVLQVWNTRTLQDESLQKSWLIGVLPAEDVTDAWHAWEAMLGGKGLAERLLLKTGLPIYHADDPRLEYKQESLANFARLDAEDMNRVMQQPVFAFNLWSMPEKIALAAGNQAEMQVVPMSIESRPEQLLFIYNPETGQLMVSSLDQYGEDSETFEGWELQTEDGTSLGKIRQARLCANYSATCGGTFVMLDSHGNPQKLIRGE